MKYSEVELGYVKKHYLIIHLARMSGNFEQRFGHINVNFAAACNSGTSGLHAALYAAGVSSGDEVIVPPNSDTDAFSHVFGGEADLRGCRY